MPRLTVSTICVCCQTPGLHHARGLIHSCYVRHLANRNLHRFPRPVQAETWIPVTPKGQQVLARYAELVAERATPQRIRWELSLSERQLQRYAIAHRTLTASQQSRSAA